MSWNFQAGYVNLDSLPAKHCFFVGRNGISMDGKKGQWWIVILRHTIKRHKKEVFMC